MINLDSVKALKKSLPVDVIIHTAALSKTDECENNKEKCYAANVIATKNLIFTYRSVKFVYFSTCAVYNTPEGKCEETALTRSTNYYIGKKLQSETLMTITPGSVIFRSSVIFGFTTFERASKNYFMQLLYIVRKKKVIRSPADRYFNPFHVDIVAKITIRAIEQDAAGIYNLEVTEIISKYEFNKKILRHFSLTAIF